MGGSLAVEQSADNRKIVGSIPTLPKHNKGNNMSDLVYKALAFAKFMHRDQTRKYTGEPYYNHVSTVAETIIKANGSEEAIAAAYLHDVVEDTDATIELIQTLFGEKVAILVNYVTDISKKEDGNRKIRKTMDRAYNASGPYESKLIKLADLIDNTKSIVEQDPKFAKIYMEEKQLLMNAMAKDDPSIKNTNLWAIAHQQVISYCAEKIRY